MQALMKYPVIDLSESFMVGDSICDVQLAEKLNIPVYGINIDYKYEKFTKIKSLKELIYLLRIYDKQSTNSIKTVSPPDIIKQLSKN